MIGGFMDFQRANQCADEIARTGDSDLHKSLVSMCTPYLLYLRKKLGFCSITETEVREELASDAVSDAIMKADNDKCFVYRLKNTFRDVCRIRVKITREHDANQRIADCDIRVPKLLMGTGTPPPAPPVESQKNELVKMANDILVNHDPFSRKVVIQKSRGATYPDMSDIFETTSNECKRVYWHDLLHIRALLNPNSGKN